MGELMTNVDGADALWEAQQAIRRGDWPEEHLDALLAPIAELAGQEPTGFHHIGYTYPNRRAFAAALTAVRGELIASDMTAGDVTHHRRYVRVPRDGGPDTFIEHHLPGEDGNGISGVHLDFVFEDAEAMLRRVRSSLEGRADAEVVTQPFPGGFAPVGKVALRTLGAALETGIMVRATWSDPREW